MSGLINLQQVLRNITSVEKVQQLEQYHAQTEQARLEHQNQKASENRGKKVEDVLPSDKVDISVKYDRQKGGKSDNKEEDEKESKDNKEPDDNKHHIDISV